MASVNALPEAWPALRMLTISASLLTARTSLMMGFKGWTLLEPRILEKPSLFEDGLENKREKIEVGGGLRGISV